MSASINAHYRRHYSSFPWRRECFHLEMPARGDAKRTLVALTSSRRSRKISISICRRDWRAGRSIYLGLWFTVTLSGDERLAPVVLSPSERSPTKDQRPTKQFSTGPFRNSRKHVSMLSAPRLIHHSIFVRAIHHEPLFGANCPPRPWTHE